MIRSIRLLNWRSYVDATIDLDRRVVFFVAPNGVGKTSVYEAARCCLFGFPKANAGRAVRAGAKRAEISMELALGDSTVVVTRTLTAGGRTDFSADHDGHSLDETAFRALLQHTWAADTALLDRLVFGDSDLRSATSTRPLPVRQHLAELLGVTPLLEAAAVLRSAESQAASVVSTMRTEAATSATAISKAQATLAGAEKSQAQLQRERQDVYQRIADAEAGVRAADAWEAYRSEATLYNDALATLIAEMSEALTIAVDDPTEALDAARQGAERELTEARDAAAAAGRSAALAATAAELLANVPEVCPTCLRPLSDEECAVALQAHGATTAAAETQTERANEATGLAEHQLRTIGEFTRRLDRLQRPSPPPCEDPGAAPAVALAELRITDSDLAERLGEVRASLAAATASLSAAQEQAETAAMLQRAASEELLLGTMASICEAVANHYLNERIEPLQADIEHRWKLIFGTEGLLLDPSGNVRLRRGDLELDVEDMSGGERAVAGVIVRLLVAAAATHIPTIWFDEPLEHLDPRRRVGIAQSLAAAAAAGTIDQIVATTYEEGIARRLALAAPDVVAVVYADDRPTGEFSVS
jgi:DNA repair exonuclease SbcCD ATPase subunit